jgi:hypothetical protein
MLLVAAQLGADTFEAFVNSPPWFWTVSGSSRWAHAVVLTIGDALIGFSEPGMPASAQHFFFTPFQPTFTTASPAVALGCHCPLGQPPELSGCTCRGHQHPLRSNLKKHHIQDYAKFCAGEHLTQLCALQGMDSQCSRQHKPQLVMHTATATARRTSSTSNPLSCEKTCCHG